MTGWRHACTPVPARRPRCLVDFDDTLVDYTAEEAAAMTALRDMLPASADRRAWTAAYKAAKGAARSLAPTRAAIADPCRLRIVLALQAVGARPDEQLVDRAVTRYWQARYRNLRLLPGAAAVLAELRACAEQMVLCTHGSALRQQDRLRLAGLAGYFDAVRVSEQVAATKADWPRFLGADYDPTARYLVISDQQIPDLVAATEIGMCTVHVTAQPARPGQQGPGPCLRVRSLPDLPPLLKGLGKVKDRRQEHHD